MKRWIVFILCGMLIITTTGCGEKQPAGRKYDTSTGVDDIMKAAMSENAAETAKAEDASADQGSEVSSEATAGQGSEAGGEATAGQGSEAGGEATAGQESVVSNDGNASGKQNSTAGSSEVSESQGDPGQNTSGQLTDEETEFRPGHMAGSSEGVDVDLTQLSSTMVYSEVFAMMMAPEDYDGKIVKMTGLYNFYHDAMVDKDYHACVVQDATACCAQGIDFVLADEDQDESAYPEIDEEITVTGEFNIYQEGEYRFFRLKDAVLEKETS